MLLILMLAFPKELVFKLLNQVVSLGMRLKSGRTQLKGHDINMIVNRSFEGKQWGEVQECPTNVLG